MKQLTLDALLKSVNENSSVNSLVQSSPVCHKVFDPEYNLRFMSKVGVQALKIENVEEFYGKAFPTDAAPKATRDIVKKYMQLASKGETNTIEYSFEVDGKVIWYGTTISPHFNAEGKLVYITADSIDITNNKKIEETNRTLLETSPICLKEILKNDAGYTLKYMSLSGQKELGITDISELYGCPYPPDFYPDKAKASLTDALDRVVRTGESTQVEYELLDPHGGPLWLLSTFSVKRKNEDGKVISITGASQNVTERVKGQLAIAKAKDEAEKANQAKSEFLARMSHELRTPMNAILGFTQLLELDIQNPLNDYQRENIRRVSSAGKYLLKLIDEVLDVSRIESGNIDLSVELVDIVSIVSDVITISKPLADERSISLINQKIPDGSLWAKVDPIRLKQVVLNLVSNAIKYNNPNGSVFISFDKLGGDNIRIGIRDNGHGIAEDKKNKLFKPFERFDIYSDQIEGTGIGLTIAQKLIELMSGSIGFESVAGEGSFFYVDVPASDKSPMPVQVGDQISSSNDSRVNSNIKKILYVDDVPSNLELVEQIIKTRQDLEILSALTALDGIELAKSQKPELILMDINMPGMNGMQAFNKLKTAKETRNIPVIALTANAMDGDIKKALDMGFKSYITKPINIPDFFDKINKAFAA